MLGPMKIAAVLLCVALAFACGGKSKHDLLSKAENVETKTELEQALGAPDQRDKMGPVEIWTYQASDGKVTFVITGETVALQTTAE
jgi:hypothetical protein